MAIYTRKQLENYAEALIWGVTTARPGFKKGDIIQIRFDSGALDLLDALYPKLVKRGFHVLPKMLPTPAMETAQHTLTSKEQRRFIFTGEKEFWGSINGDIVLKAPASLTHLKGVPQDSLSDMALTRNDLRAIRVANEEKGLAGWTLCTYPTEELARQAGLPLKEYARQIAKACYLDEKDPAKKWNEIMRDSTKIKKWLNSLGIDTIRTESKSMDLEVKFGEQRKFIGVSGHNIPSFELFTSPDWRGTKGVYFANFPSYKDGNYVEGVRLEFKAGRAVKIGAEKGEKFVQGTLATDRGACQVGEYSLTDRRFSKIDKFMADTLFDENHGGKHGNSHIAVGSSYSDTYTGDIRKLTPALKEKLGYNRSAVHWDLVNTEDKKVTATLRNGKKVTIYEKGQFKY